MIRITFEAKNREDLIESIRDYLGDESYTHKVTIAPPIQIPVPAENPEPAPVPEQKQPEPEPACKITKEDVRQVLIYTRGSFGSAGLRGLLTRFNASNLDEINPKDYQAIVNAATEMLKDAANNG